MPKPLFKPGTPKPVDSGRKKGTPNKITLTVKEQIEKCYKAIGGDKRFSEWADANPDLFYVHIYPKIIPKDIHVTGTIGVAQLLIEAGNMMKLVEHKDVTPALETQNESNVNQPIPIDVTPIAPVASTPVAPIPPSV